eukprot:m.184485 g.184485  ORF g.184485 m.184485 type:complete len:1298 (-) comp32192_c0_seq1:212-4105(-)
MSWLTSMGGEALNQVSSFAKDVISEGFDEEDEVRSEQDEWQKIAAERDAAKEAAESAELQISSISKEYRNVLIERENEVKRLQSELHIAHEEIGRLQQSVALPTLTKGETLGSSSADGDDLGDILSSAHKQNQLAAELEQSRVECAKWKQKAEYLSEKSTRKGSLQTEDKETLLAAQVQDLEYKLRTIVDNHQEELSVMQDMHSTKCAEIETDLRASYERATAAERRADEADAAVEEQEQLLRIARAGATPPDSASESHDALSAAESDWQIERSQLVGEVSKLQMQLSSMQSKQQALEDSQRTTLGDHQAQVAKMKREISNYKSKATQLELLMVDDESSKAQQLQHQQQVQQQQQQHQQLQQQLAQSTQRCSQLESEIKELNAAVESTRTESQRLRSNFEQEQAASREACTSLEQDLARERVSLATKEEEVNRLTTQCLALQSQPARPQVDTSAEQINAITQHHLQQTETLRQNLASQITQKDAMIASKDLEIAAKASEISAKDSEIAVTHRNVQEQALNLEKMQTMLQQINTSTLATQQQLQHKESELIKLANTISQLETALGDANSKSNAEISTLQTQITNLNDVISKQTQGTEKLKELSLREATIASDEIMRLTDALRRSETDVNSLKAETEAIRVATSKTDTDEVVRELSTQRRVALANLESQFDLERDTLNDTIAAKQTQTDSLINEVSTLQNSIQQLQQQADETQNQFDLLVKQFMQQKNEKLALEEIIKTNETTSTDMIKSLQSEKDQKLRSESDLSSQLATATTNHETVVAQLEHHKQLLATTTSELQTANAEVERLQAMTRAMTSDTGATEVLKLELQEQSGALEAAKRELSVTTLSCASLEQRLQEALAQVVALSHTVATETELKLAAEKNLLQVTTNNTSQAQTLASLQLELTTARSNVGSPTNDAKSTPPGESLQDMKSARDRLASQLEKLQKHLIHSEEQHTEETVVLEEELGKARAEIERLRMNHVGDVKEKLIELEDVKTKLKKATTRNALTVKDLERASRELQSQLAENKRLTISVTNLELALQGFEAEKDSMTTTMNETHQAEVLQLQRELEASRSLVSDVQATATVLQQKTSEIEGLRGELNMSSGLCKSLENDMRRLQNELSGCQARLADTITSASSSMVDKEVVKNMVVSFCERSGHQKEQALLVLANLLEFDKGERYAAGIRERRGFFSSLMSGPVLAPPTPNKQPKANSFADDLVNFMMEEANATENPDPPPASVQFPATNFQTPLARRPTHVTGRLSSENNREPTPFKVRPFVPPQTPVGPSPLNQPTSPQTPH